MQIRELLLPRHNQKNIEELVGPLLASTILKNVEFLKSKVPDRLILRNGN